MFYELISVIAAGFAGAGIGLLLRRFAKNLPRWVVPICAGAAMLTVAISNEYSWFGRQEQALPEGLQIVESHDSRAFWRPWTYLVPFKDRFTALDKVSELTNPDLPQLRILNLYHYTRWQPIRRSTVVFDCANAAQATLPQGAELSPDGTLVGATWGDPGPAFPHACES